MLEVEVFGAGLTPAETARLCELAAAGRGVRDGHVAVEYVMAEQIAALNVRHRGKREATDVLSFPIDEDDEWEGRFGGVPRELGDVVICPSHTADLREAVVHGMLHLLGMDHEHDDGEMLALQREILSQAGAPR